jgi:AraC-like DNA-binding protein
MKRNLYHQSQNTGNLLITSYPYDYNHWEFGTPHFHMNYEILVAARGSFDCFIGERTFVLQEGDAILIQPLQIHGLHVHEGSLVWCSTFAEQFFMGVAAVLSEKKATNPVFHPDPIVTEFYLDRMDRYIGRRRSLRAEQITALQENVFKSCVYAMGSAFLEQAELTGASGKADALALEMVRYIQQNFKNDITLGTVAEQLSYNYQYLSKVFNLTFGASFKQILNRFRLEHAISLLSESDLPIGVVASESGFQSMRSFDYVCKEIYGLSPKEIRNSKKV